MATEIQKLIESIHLSNYSAKDTRMILCLLMM